MLHRAILLLFAIPGLIQRAAGENESVFECKHVRALAMMQIIAPAIAAENSARLREENGQIVVTGGSPELHKKLRELEPLVDYMKVSISTKFIRLHQVDVTLAAALVAKAFDREGKQENSLQAVPSARTRQVFVFGSLEDMRTAEVLLLKLDRFCASAGGGIGWRMLGWAGGR